MFGWKFLGDSTAPVETMLMTRLIDREKTTVAQERQAVTMRHNTEFDAKQHFHLDRPHLWNAKAVPYLYTLNVRLEDMQGNVLDEVEQPFGLRFYRVDRDSGLILQEKDGIGYSQNPLGQCSAYLQTQPD